MSYIFAYGTLKEGFPNHGILNGKFVQEARTKPLYRLYDNGFYPCLAKDKNGLMIEGEIYDVDDMTLARLSACQGVPVLFSRQKIEMEKFIYTVTAFFYVGDVSGMHDCGTSWPRKK